MPQHRTQYEGRHPPFLPSHCLAPVPVRVGRELHPAVRQVRARLGGAAGARPGGVGGHPFTADLSRGVVGFEPGLEVRAELIGTEADNPGSWMWAWANPSGFPDRVTAAARHARAYGEQQGVTELTTGEIPLDGTALGYRLAVVTCGLAGGYAYYPATAAPGTTAYLLLD